ncbi:Armadillo/beta-catenin-like repeat-containing protein [Ceraceosorus bombacis]|uniref:Armadillo/beta-catenin-like repeat-containing protein n=1 Tax=Ceraceosorus bombacis TaxID=401625 RepID=A0A0P1BTB1_9BASI|nr:Armadillo/beta-catenin-like repeat-containing protein [Ceraceosorus bombacis]
MSERNLDQLLKWSIAAQGEGSGTGAGAGAGAGAGNGSIDAQALAAQPGMKEIAAEVAAGKRPDLQDPGLLDALMGGKSEAQMMKEELAVACNEQRSTQDRCIALDNFEMLIESIDNANNIKNMGMWPPLLSLLASKVPAILSGALWVVGTAIQNNDKAQMALLSHKPLQAILDSLRWADVDASKGASGSAASTSEAEAIRSKAAYALSALLKHNPPAVVAFDELDGWQALRGALEDPSIAIRRKVVFLINTLLLQAQQDQVADGTDVEEADHVGDAAAATTVSDGTTAVGTGTDADPIRSAAASTRSASTALTSLPGQPASSNAHGSAAPSAPLERGPETHREGIAYPDIPRALLHSGIVQTLLSSLLPANKVSASVASLKDGAQARDDLDYSEKASRAVANFVESVCEKGRGNEELRRGMRDGAAVEAKLLDLLSDELEGAPLRGSTEEDDEAQRDVKSRWQQVGFEPAEWEQLRERASNMAAGDAAA